MSTHTLFSRKILREKQLVTLAHDGDMATHINPQIIIIVFSSQKRVCLVALVAVCVLFRSRRLIINGGGEGACPHLVFSLAFSAELWCLSCIIFSGIPNCAVHEIVHGNSHPCRVVGGGCCRGFVSCCSLSLSLVNWTGSAVYYCSFSRRRGKGKSCIALAMAAEFKTSSS